MPDAPNAGMRGNVRPESRHRLDRGAALGDAGGMITMLVACFVLPIGMTEPPEHLKPLPLYNGEATNGENWGWLHAESRGGGALEQEGSARVIPLAKDADYDSEYFDGSVVALNAGATAVTTAARIAGRVPSAISSSRHHDEAVGMMCHPQGTTTTLWE